MIIDGGLIDASLGDDVPDARALEAFLGKQMDSGLDNGLARIFGRSDHRFPQFKRSFEQSFIFRVPAKGKFLPAGAAGESVIILPQTAV